MNPVGLGALAHQDQVVAFVLDFIDWPMPDVVEELEALIMPEEGQR